MSAWGYVKPTPGNDKLDKPSKLAKPEKSLSENKFVKKSDLKEAFMNVRDATRGGFGAQEHITSKYEKKTLAERLLPRSSSHDAVSKEELRKEIKKETDNLKHYEFDAKRQGEGLYERSRARDYRRALDEVKKKLLGG